MQRIFNEYKTKEIAYEDIDWSKFTIEQDKLFIKHHEATEKVEEQYHYEVVKIYDNGGKDVKKVIDVPKVEAKEAYDEYEDILVLRPLNEVESALRKIDDYKQKLFDTDYQAIKFAEGELSAEEYEETKQQRRKWREEINKLELIINNQKNSL